MSINAEKTQGMISVWYTQVGILYIKCDDQITIPALKVGCHWWYTFVFILKER